MATLFEIGQDMLLLNEAMEHSEETGDPSDFAALFDAFALYTADLAGQEATKLDSYVALIKTLEMERGAAKAQADAFEHKARTRAARLEWLKDKMKQHLEATGRTTVRTEKGYTVSVQKNGGKPPLFVNENYTVDEIDPEFHKLTVTIDKDKVRKALEEGRPVIFASIEKPGTHLRIK